MKKYKKTLILFFINFVTAYTILFLPRLSAISSTPETLDQAIKQVEAVYLENTDQPERIRAENAARKAIDLIHARVWIFNYSVENKVRHYWALKWYPEYKKDFDKFWYLRQSKQGKERAKLAWDYKLGACEECAALMNTLLTGAGVKNVKILKSDSPHAFPVIDFSPDTDPDIPWTWGNKFWIPDAWTKKIYTSALEVWNDKDFFDKGEHYVDWAVKGKTPTRMELKFMVLEGRKDKSYIEARCDIYKKLYALYTKIPEKHRSLGLDKGVVYNSHVTIEPELTPDMICVEKVEGDVYHLVDTKVNKSTDTRRAINETEYTFKIDEEKSVIFKMIESPPKDICAGIPFTFKISGEAINVGLLYSITAAWKTEEGKALKGAKFLRNGVTIGVFEEDDVNIPNASGTFEAVPPKEYEGTEIRLKLFYGYALGIEPTYVTWIDFIYRKK